MDVILSVGNGVQPWLKVDAIVKYCTSTAWLCHTTETSGNATALARMLLEFGVKAQLVALQTFESGCESGCIDTYHAVKRLKSIKLSDDSLNLIDETAISSFITRAHPQLKFIRIENNLKWIEREEGEIREELSLPPSKCLELAPALIKKGRTINGKSRYIPKPRAEALKALTSAGLVARFDDFESPCLGANDGIFITPEGVLGVFAFLNPKKAMATASQAWDECQSLSESSILILIGEEAESCAQQVSYKVRDFSIFAINDIADQALVANVARAVLASPRQRCSIHS